MTLKELVKQEVIKLAVAGKEEFTRGNQQSTKVG